MQSATSLVINAEGGRIITTAPGGPAFTAAGDAGGLVLQNSGEISAVRGTGIDLSLVNPGQAVISVTNSGLIAGSLISYAGSINGDELANSGIMVGQVQTGNGSDRVVNDGLIRGSVDMGGDGDVYSGVSGRVTDAVRGGAGNDTVAGGAFADILDGGTENDRLIGGGGNDTLLGRAGNDSIFGSEGNDRIIAGAGVDVLTGGSGADIFVFTSAATVGIGAGRDQIADFAAGVDHLDMLFMAAFIGNAAFTAAGQVRYIQATGIVTGSTDADPAAEWALLLVNRPVLTAGDFVF